MLDRQSAGSLHPWAYPPPLQRACIGQCGATSRTRCCVGLNGGRITDRRTTTACSGVPAAQPLCGNWRSRRCCQRYAHVSSAPNCFPESCPVAIGGYCGDLVLRRVRAGDSALSCLTDPGLLRLHQVDQARQCGLPMRANRSTFTRLPPRRLGPRPDAVKSARGLTCLPGAIRLC